MSKDTSAGLGEVGFWIYDASLALLLADLISIVEAQPVDERPQWWVDVVEDLRIDASYGDRHFDVGLGLGKDEQIELAALYEMSADQVQARHVFTPEEAASWAILDNASVIFRGAQPVDTEPTAQLGHVLADLIRGSFSSAPSGHQWYYGVANGPLTIRLKT